MSREEREDQPIAYSPILARYEATVQAVEAERDALVELVERLERHVKRVRVFVRDVYGADIAMRDDEAAGK